MRGARTCVGRGRGSVTLCAAWLLLCPACIEHTLEGESDADALDAGQSDEAAALAPDAGPEVRIVDADLRYDAYTLTQDASPDSEPEAKLPACALSADDDHDGDGYAASDCDDCDDAINPGAYDVPGNGFDEDCSGKADDEVLGCDRTLAAAANDAVDAVRALGLCRKQSGEGWGVLGARWSMPDGTKASLAYESCPAGRLPHTLSHAVRDSYGAQNLPREGDKLAVLSSGIAAPGMQLLGPEWLPAVGVSPSAMMCTASKPPPGFPKAAHGCALPEAKPLVTDGVALELQIKAPSNALGLAFDFFFLTSEFPNFVCQGKSDHFVALLKSKHPATPADGNISFDAHGNVVSVDTAFLDVCTPGTYEGHTFACSRGTKLIEGLGFQQQAHVSGGLFVQGGATGWLQTVAPIVPGETLTLRFAIWDTADPLADSSVLLDNLRWIIPTHPPKAAPPPPPPPEKPATTWIELL